MNDPIRARLDELTVSSPTTSRGSVYLMADALRAVVALCAELDDRARLVGRNAESYIEGWADGVYEVTTGIEDAIADALGVPAGGRSEETT